jgi:hypothetical protein
MSKTSTAFDYDIAFSFHSKDEGIATELNDRLRDRFNTFLYSERQKELAGTDGEKTFNAVFGKQARFVVIFYRKEWGETAFTRIEQTAIRNRAYEGGFDFTLFIPTEKPASVPDWLPKPRLYYGHERFGLDGAAAVIEARVQDMGGKPRVESIAERAARASRALEFQKEQNEFVRSEKGVNAARKAYEILRTTMDNEADAVRAAHANLPIKTRRLHESYLLHGLGPCLHLHWWCQFTNSIERAPLKFEFLSSPPRLPGLFVFEEPEKLRMGSFDFRLLGPQRAGYLDEDAKREFSAEDLGIHLLREYIGFAETYTAYGPHGSIADVSS